ncbi:MAG: fatty acid desaturase [Candidatus Aenigmarchaeota archaeon]|nr:fatty acid desaturase [Candidatus Aenigmarchaeota archaeon]
MADVLTLLQQFLCYNNSQCMQQFQQYAYKPMEGIFYAVFFPILFILLFVYIISSALGTFRENTKFRILIAVAVFAFIILQGWYGFFMMLGKLWLYVIVLLGFFWILMHTFVGSRGSGDGRARTAESLGRAGIGGSILARVGKDIRGETKNLEKEIDMSLNELKVVESSVKRGDTQAWRMAATLLERLHSLRKDYIAILKGPGGLTYGGKFKQYESKIDKAIKRLQEIQSKAPSD